MLLRFRRSFNGLGTFLHVISLLEASQKPVASNRDVNVNRFCVPPWSLRDLSMFAVKALLKVSSFFYGVVNGVVSGIVGNQLSFF